MDCGKIKFTTRVAAGKALRASAKERGLKQTYFCNDCQAWHTTSGGRGRKSKGHRESLVTKKKIEVPADIEISRGQGVSYLNIRNYTCR